MRHEFWSDRAKNILKSEIKRKGVRYKDLLSKLAEIGVDESYNSFTTKVNRGTFSFAFFLECMKALGTSKVDLE